MLGISWDRAIDMDYYYVLENVQFAVISEEGSSGDIATIPELYVRKDGVYGYDKETGNGGWSHTDSLEDYLRLSPGWARWGVTFDEQGFITAWHDAQVM